MRRAISGPDADDMEAQLHALGGPAQIDAVIDRPVAVTADMLDALRLFGCCGTQWRLGPDGSPTGLDYAAARTVCDWLGLAGGERLLDDLRALEAGALDALAERRR